MQEAQIKPSKQISGHRTLTMRSMNPTLPHHTRRRLLLQRLKVPAPARIVRRPAALLRHRPLDALHRAVRQLVHLRLVLLGLLVVVPVLLAAGDGEEDDDAEDDVDLHGEYGVVDEGGTSSCVGGMNVERNGAERTSNSVESTKISCYFGGRYNQWEDTQEV